MLRVRVVVQQSLSLFLELQDIIHPSNRFRIKRLDERSSDRLIGVGRCQHKRAVVIGRTQKAMRKLADGTSEGIGEWAEIRGQRAEGRGVKG